MSKSIFKNILVIIKYQCLGIKAACDASFYNLITFHPVMATYDIIAAIILGFSTFFMIPAAAVFNVVIISWLKMFNKESFQITIKNLENIYQQGAEKTKEEYQVYVDQLRQ